MLVAADPLAGPGGSGRVDAGERQRAIVGCAALAEQLGFDSLWLAGPHGPASAPAVVLAAIAARTTRLRLGAELGLGEGLDPLRVAEDFATLDGISAGRVELGIATGRSDGESGERLRESVALLRRLWSETEVTWSGRFRAALAGVTVEPRPVQQPHPPLWIGGGAAAEAADLAGELGLPLLLHEPSDDWEPLAGRYRDRAARAGHRARVGAAGPAPGGSPAEAAAAILAARERLGLEVQLVRFDRGGLPEPELHEALARFGAAVLPLLRAA